MYGQSQEDRERLEDKLRREREAGMHWIEMTESMGGTGIVFVSILAGKSSAFSQPPFSKALTDVIYRGQP